jgi:hypothetical protein
MDPVRRFEITVLRPVWATFLLGGLISAVTGHWLWALLLAIGVLYAGTIGSRLHPRQSVVDLAIGPLAGSGALAEATALPAALKDVLVGHACTRVGILIGITLGLALPLVFDVRWYWGVGAALVSVVAVGALLKVAFTLPPAHHG